MISPVGKRYVQKDTNSVVRVVGYDRSILNGRNYIRYTQTLNDGWTVENTCPVDVFREQFSRVNQYTKQKQELKL